MKRSSRRGSAVLDAPEESYALSTTVDPGRAVREPAPAGAFQRAAAYGDPVDSSHEDEEAYVPRRGSVKFKLRTAMPKGLAGRLVFGSLALLVLGAIVATWVGVRRYLMHDTRFAVATSSEIEITGNEHLTRAQVLSVFGSDLERNIFKVPLAERRSDLEHLPWIAHATVMRLLPNHLRIAVVERTPVAFVRQGTELGLVDANGVLLDMPADSAGDPEYSFPVLTGLSAGDPLSTRAARMAVYAKFMHDLDAGGEKLTRTLSEVDVSNPEDVKALIASGSADILVHFGDEDFLNRYHEFKQHLPEWLSQYPKLSSADMRYERQVVLEMQPGAGGASSSPVAGTTTTTSDAAVSPVATPAATPPAKAPAKAAAPQPARPKAHVESAEQKRAAAARAMKLKLAHARAAASKRAAPVTHPAAGQRKG